MNPNFCKTCGEPLRPEMTVCPGCGRPLAPQDGQKVPPAAGGEPADDAAAGAHGAGEAPPPAGAPAQDGRGVPPPVPPYPGPPPAPGTPVYYTPPAGYGAPPFSPPPAYVHEGPRYPAPPHVPRPQPQDPVTFGSCFLMGLIGLVPVAGLIYLAFQALLAPERPNRRTIARALLTARLVFLGLVLSGLFLLSLGVALRRIRPFFW